MGLRLNILNRVLRLGFKPVLTRIRTPAQMRWHFNLFARLMVRVPAGVTLTETAGAPPMLWVTPDDARGGRVLLYFHGGGYVAGSPHTHRGLAARLAILTGVPVALPRYSLGPERPLPAAMDDARAAWDDLVAQGFDPDDIALGGDSAGGGLALSLLANLVADGTMPAALVLFSPWTDLAGGSASMTANVVRDPMLPAHRLPDLVDFATGRTMAADDPRISPLFAFYPKAPPVLFQVSDTEILRDDTTRMAEKLRKIGTEVRVETWSNTPHVWQLMDRTLPEARAALRQAASFLTEIWGRQAPDRPEI